MGVYAQYPNVRRAAKQKGDIFREKLAEIKLASGCADCGYNAAPEALDFDHLDRATKFRTVSSMVTYAWARVLEEIVKCEVVCSNCHRIRSFARGDTGRQLVYAR